LKKIDYIILPSSYLPSSDYFSLILKYNNILIEVNDFYIKQSIRNHTIILGPNGDQKLTVPIQRKDKSKTIFKNLKISNDKWKKKQIQSIKTAYGKSPFFIYYIDDIIELINQDSKTLLELNQKIFNYFIKEFRIKKNIKLTNEYIKNYGEKYIDFRSKKIDLGTNNSINYLQTFLSSNNNLKKYSVIDLLFNQGNNSKDVLLANIKKNK
tara:strand:- start:33 stop:662 length:630 start_codon:yes stop_codon:yes gene_type:complete